MYAIVECGGRQYRAEEGHTFSVEKLPHEVGEQIELDNVLLLSNDGNITIGQPTISGASVLATVTDQYRGKKIFVWKYKPKKRYRKRRGHRQYYTRLRIDSIVVGGNGGVKVAKKAAPVEAEPVVEETPVVEAPVVEAPEEPTVVVAPADVEEPTMIVEPEAEAVPAPVDEDATIIVDDLKLIEGIGPKTATILMEANVMTFADLAGTSVDRLREILNEASVRGTPDTWPEQAALAAAGDMDGLKELQDALDGGRRA